MRRGPRQRRETFRPAGKTLRAIKTRSPAVKLASFFSRDNQVKVFNALEARFGSRDEVLPFSCKIVVSLLFASEQRRIYKKKKI